MPPYCNPAIQLFSYVSFSAETIKGIHSDQCATNSQKSKQDQTVKISQTPSRDVPHLKFDYLNLRDDNEAKTSSENMTDSGYSEEEKKVLAVTSMINGREYVPFMSVDLKERFAFPVPYTGVNQKVL